jgi:hypothetical protein
MNAAACRRFATAGQYTLIVLGLAWAVFERPAPVISVRWRDGIPQERRFQLERQFYLEGRREAAGAWLYDLGWPSQSNIAAIVRSPDVVDTHHLNRTAYRLDENASLSGTPVWWFGPFRGSPGRMWFRVLVALIAACVLICEWRARQSTVSRHLRAT